MSARLPRDQQRALAAHAHIQRVLDEADERGRQKYGSMCHKAPILVHNTGLVAALHFLAARGDAMQRAVLDDLAAQIHAAGLTDGGGREDLLAAARGAPPARTRALTREVQRCLLWYKRFTQSMLKVEAGDDGDEGDE